MDKDSLPFIDKSEILSALFRKLYETRINLKKTEKQPRKNLNIELKTEILKKVIILVISAVNN
jgi:hypothetical protein